MPFTYKFSDLVNRKRWLAYSSHKCVQTIEVQPKLKFMFIKKYWLKDTVIIQREQNSLFKHILQEFQYGYNIVETTIKLSDSRQ